MKVYQALFSLLKSYKLYIFFHIVLFSILMYVFFSIKFVDILYNNFMSYKYGFTPDIALIVSKDKDLEKLIKQIQKSNIKFSHKIGAIKTLDNVRFSKDDYISLNMNIDLMGLYFDNKVYANISTISSSHNKCLIVDIKNVNKNWIFYLDECEIDTKKVFIKTINGDIPFKLRKRKGLYRLKTSNLSNNQSVILYQYLVKIINSFDDINHIGIKPPIKIYTNNDNILENKKRILRDYLGIIYNSNLSFVPSLVSQDIYKQISWIKRQNVFIDINTSEFNETLYVYNEFYNSMNKNVILTKFNKKYFNGEYKQFVYLFSDNHKLYKYIKDKFPNITIKSKNQLLNFQTQNSLLMKSIIWFLGFFIYFIALLISIMSLSKFYKKFQHNLLAIKSFDYKIYIYTLYLSFILVVSLIISTLFFNLTTNMINQYMKSYFYPIINVRFDYFIDILIIATILFVVFLFETKEHKDLK